jgi:hypothetical protein
VPLSKTFNMYAERTLAPLIILFSGLLHFIKGLLPEGPSKVRVRFCPCSR